MRFPFLPVLLFVPLCFVAAQNPDPATDRAGSVTATIPIPALGSYGAGGLAEFKTPGKPVTVTVELGNSGSAPIHGTVRIQVIDEWTADPAAPVAFTLPAHGHADVAFRVQFGSGTFNAHYPIHAFVEFEEGGRKLVAHPIRIIQIQRPNPPLAGSPVEWKPFQVSANGSLALWRLPIHREHVKVEQIAGPGTQPGVAYEARPTVNFHDRETRGHALEAI
ncbi:MAG: NEW3 domain-containing protein, partial [Bryobacteraceae bacterium]|nr:NEW3 domain-containing protein [Bryobacteraceae bacterium]